MLVASSQIHGFWTIQSLTVGYQWNQNLKWYKSKTRPWNNQGLQPSNTWHSIDGKQFPHPSRETYQTNGNIFAFFSDFPQTDMGIPRPITAFTSPARSMIHKKRARYIGPTFAKHFGKESVPWIWHQFARTKSKGHAVKKGKSSKPQTKSIGDLKCHNSFHLQGTLKWRNGRPNASVRP